MVTKEEMDRKSKRNKHKRSLNPTRLELIHSNTYHRLKILSSLCLLQIVTLLPHRAYPSVTSMKKQKQTDPKKYTLPYHIPTTAALRVYSCSFADLGLSIPLAAVCEADLVVSILGMRDSIPL